MEAVRKLCYDDDDAEVWGVDIDMALGKPKPLGEEKRNK